MSQSSKIMTGGSWALFKIIAVQCINFSAIAILSRQLDPVDFGIVALANVALQFFNMFSTQGINQFVIYDNSVNREQKLSSAFWLNLFFSLTLMLIGIAAIPWITKFYEEPLLASILMILFLRFPIDAISKLPDAILHKSLDFKPIEIRDTILQFTVASLSISMALLDYGVWSLIIPSVIAAPIRLIVAFRISSWRPRLNFYVKYWKEIIKYSSNIIGGTVTNFIISQGDTLLVGKILGSSQLGIYNISWNSSNLVSRTLVKITSKLAFPAFSAKKGDNEKIYKTLKRVLFVIANLSFPILMWMFISAENIILVLYGDKWNSAIIPFQILLIYAIRYSVGSPIGAVFKAVGRPDLGFKLGLAIIPFYVLGILMGSNYGIVGVALGVTISRTVFGLLSFWIVAKLINQSALSIMRPLRTPFFHALISCLIAYSIQCIVERNFSNLIFELLISMLLMIFSYILLARLYFKRNAEFVVKIIIQVSGGKINLGRLFNTQTISI